MYVPFTGRSSFITNLPRRDNSCVGFVYTQRVNSGRPLSHSNFSSRRGRRGAQSAIGPLHSLVSHTPLDLYPLQDKTRQDKFFISEGSE